MKSIQRISKEQLANGDTLIMTKIGREYQLSIQHIDDSPPEIKLRLNKKQVYARWGEILRHDVLELDD